MSNNYFFYSSKLNQKKIVKIGFTATNSVAGGDQTYFIDKVEVIDSNNQVVNAGLINNDFSTPSAPNGYYHYFGGENHPELGWLFEGGCGIATNGSDFNVPGTPDGNAVAFLQGDAAKISQNVTLASGKYRIRFLAAQRNNYQNNDGYVTIDGVNLTYIYPSRGNGFQVYTSDEFTV